MVPAKPLASTQTGIFEHKVLYVIGMGPKLHSACTKIIRQHRGSRASVLSKFVTHIIAGANCHDADKASILQAAGDQGELCHVVDERWLLACQDVRLQPLVLHSRPQLACVELVPRSAVASRRCQSAERGRERCVTVAEWWPGRSDYGAVVQAEAAVDEAPFAVDLAAWRAECGSSVPPSQVANVLAGRSFYLGLLTDDDERRQAKEIVRLLGGQVCPAIGWPFDWTSRG